MNNFEDEYYWEIKRYLEQPDKDTLLELLEHIYRNGFADGYMEAGPTWLD